jgi:branched-chain amino acid transport system substrate-binding protein
MPARRTVLGCIASAALAGRASAQVRTIRIGVLGVTSGGQAWSGPGAVLAARIAATDFSQQLDGQPVDLRSADFHERPDEAVSIAGGWYDDGVDAIVDLPIAAAAVAVQDLARRRERTVMVTSSVSSGLTAEACSRTATHWAEDSPALANATVRGLTAAGVKRWYLVTPDYAFGAELERDAIAAIARAGSQLIGIGRHPPEAPEFESPLRQAIASGADGVLLGAAGANLIRQMRAARRLGLFDAARRVGALRIYLPEVHAAGAGAMAGLYFVSGFYWNQNVRTRAFAQRFFDQIGFMPSRAHAETYWAVTHYLRAVAATRTTDALTVNEAMRRTPAFLFGPSGTVRADGRVLFGLTLYRVRSGAEVSAPWDELAPVGSIAAEDAFRPFNRTTCTRLN